MALMGLIFSPSLSQQSQLEQPERLARKISSIMAISFLAWWECLQPNICKRRLGTLENSLEKTHWTYELHTRGLRRSVFHRETDVEAIDLGGDSTGKEFCTSILTKPLVVRALGTSDELEASSVLLNALLLGTWNLKFEIWNLEGPCF